MEQILKKKNIFKKIFKNQLLVTVITFFALLFVIITSSYAVFNRDVFNTENDVIIRTGSLEVVVSSQSDMIEQNYTTLGVPDDIGMTYEPYLFTVKNTGDAKIAYYEIRLVDKEFESRLMPHKCVSYSISVNGGEYSSPQNLGDDSSYIYIGTDLEIGETVSFELKMWVNEEWGQYANNKTLKSLIEVTLYSENPIRNHIMYDTQGGSRVTKTNIIAKRITMTTPLKKGYEFLGWSTRKTGEVEYLPDDIYRLDTGITLYAVWEEGSITYDLNGGTGDIPSNKISEGITSIVPTKEGYVFKGWSTNPDAEEAEYTSGSEYTGDSVTLYAIWYLPPTLYEEVETSLASYLLAEDGDARIISGSNEQLTNNYVWYSGKLWRIVALNNDGSIKLVTQDTITTIHWNADTTYSGSWIYQWLNEDFRDTLYNYENLLVTNYQWNATQTTASTKPANTTMVEGTVGLLNYYEYVQSYSKLGTDSTAYGAGYLNNGYYWRLITPYSSSFVWSVRNRGNADFNNPSANLYGARPSVNLKSNIQIRGGEGTKTNPYTIVGDIISEPDDNELISERVSGEYVTFDNELYRIVEVENNITKITKADYIRNSSNEVVKKYFASTYLYGASGNTQNDDYWDYYLNNTWYNSISSNYKNMLVSGTWYLGTVASGNSYKNTICATSNTTETTKLCTRTSAVYNGYVGLGRIGEMFTSQLGEGYSTSIGIWTITPYSSSRVWFVLNLGNANYDYPSSYSYGARPSINLKSTIKITGGLGTKESPFVISE